MITEQCGQRVRTSEDKMSTFEQKSVDKKAFSQDVLRKTLCKCYIYRGIGAVFGLSVDILSTLVLTRCPLAVHIRTSAALP
jgi:hypothetical protein